MVTVLPELHKVSNVVQIAFIRKTVCNKLFTKVNAIDTKISSTSRLATKAQYAADKKGLEKKVTN